MPRYQLWAELWKPIRSPWRKWMRKNNSSESTCWARHPSPEAHWHLLLESWDGSVRQDTHRVCARSWWRANTPRGGNWMDDDWGSREPTTQPGKKLTCKTVFRKSFSRQKNFLYQTDVFYYYLYLDLRTPGRTRCRQSRSQSRSHSDWSRFHCWHAKEEALRFLWWMANARLTRASTLLEAVPDAAWRAYKSLGFERLCLARTRTQNLQEHFGAHFALSRLPQQCLHEHYLYAAVENYVSCSNNSWF